MFAKWVTMGGFWAGLMLAPAAMAQEPAAGGARPNSEQLLALHLQDAASYSIYRDAARTEPLELRREPIYRWSNPTRVGGQDGDVFLWTYHGRPEVVASIFSHPHQKTLRTMCHELHSLSEAVLVVDRESSNRWQPKAAGVDLKPIPDAPTPGATPAARLVQIRALARDFSGRSLSDQKQSWPLRILPRPLYRYEGTDPAVLDGAVFALISSAGTDPEIILLIEARQAPEGARWSYGAARFSDMSLWLDYKGREVWNAIRGPQNTFNHDAPHRFRFYQDRHVPELAPGAAPAPSATPKAEAKPAP